MAAPQQSGSSDNSSGPLWAIAGLFAVVIVIWYSFKKFLIAYYFKLKLLEISLFDYFTNNLEDVRTVILSTNPATVKLDDIAAIGQAVGYYVRIPCIVLIIILAFVIFFSNSVRVFKRTYSMRDLLLLEKDNWPQVSPVVPLDLVKTDIDKGPWAMAMTPMQFCKRNNLLQEYKRQNQEGMMRKDMNRIEVSLKRGQTNKLFATQLGPLWAGTSRLPIHTKALFAIFAARLMGDPTAFVLLKQLGASATTKLNFKGIDELCKKHESAKLVKQITDSHAYVLTVMASMLMGARQDGVQASADFIWLKPLDRRLWYTLNTVGRQTPFVEVAGIFAHWVAEKEMGSKLVIPMVEEATNALDVALKDIIYTREE